MHELHDLWDHREPHILITRVAAQDIDGLNHTNNAVYVKWCEQVAWSHSIALGLDLAQYRAQDRAMALTRSEYDYLAASREGDEVAVATWIADWDGKLTMWRHFQVIRSADRVTLLRARMQFDCIELSSGMPRRLPRAFLEGYGPAVLDKNT